MMHEEIGEALGKRVRLNYLTGGEAHAEGTLIGYYAEPTVIIQTDDGRQIPWVLRAAEVVKSVPEESKKCPQCDRTAEPESGRFCPREQKYRPVCVFDHCMECGAFT